MSGTFGSIVSESEIEIGTQKVSGSDNLYSLDVARNASHHLTQFVIF
jgi:hypothetical protein